MFNFFRGMNYLLQGFNHLLTPGLKRFIIIPILFNLILFTGLFFLIYYYVLPYAHHYIDKLPSWLSFFSSVFFIVFVSGFILLFLAMFTVMFNVLAAPFNGLLAERTQYLLYGHSIPSLSFTAMAVRALKRQLQFLIYFLPRFAGVGILFFIPFLQSIYPFLWFLFTAWMLSMQFQDLPLDNNLVSFQGMRRFVKEERALSLGFGSLINLLSFIPIINFLIMPAAVIGSTILYCERQIVLSHRIK